MELKQYDTALDYFQRALKLWDDVYGGQDVKTVTAICSIGNLYGFSLSVCCEVYLGISSSVFLSPSLLSFPIRFSCLPLSFLSFQLFNTLF